MHIIALTAELVLFGRDSVFSRSAFASPSICLPNTGLFLQLFPRTVSAEWVATPFEAPGLLRRTSGLEEACRGGDKMWGRGQGVEDINGGNAARSAVLGQIGQCIFLWPSSLHY